LFGVTIREILKYDVLVSQADNGRGLGLAFTNVKLII